MQFPTADQFRAVPDGTAPAYDQQNPLTRVLREVEQVRLAAERDFYVADSLQYLFPFEQLTLYGPSGGQWQESDPRRQDNKDDFQKQNIADFRLADFFLVRGYATAGDWTGAFVKLCYRGTPGTALGRATRGDPGPFIRAWVKIGASVTADYLTLPLNPKTGYYEVELWAFTGSDLRGLLDDLGRKAIDAGLLQARPDLVSGTLTDFEGAGIDSLRDALNRGGASWNLYDHAPNHALHPLRPLRIEAAFASANLAQWDSQGGRNHRVEFDMFLRGWRSFLSVGISPNPHGGVGFLEFRNLVSNYFGHEQRRREVLGDRWRSELGRDLQPGNFEAGTWRPGLGGGERVGAKVGEPKRESFMAVDYMDLHLLQPHCGIGIHRHRDNQEVFFMIEGKGLMLVGDWCHAPERDRAFEVRTMQPGDLTLCKTGQLHALYNSMDSECLLFMFGGYD
jgi:mannose-6-phosphate isomerase-like protein (cupin superfamily)